MSPDSLVLVDCFIPGPPHSQKPWVTRVIDVMLGQPRITVPCELDVEFVLPPDRVPWILPEESRLTSLVKVLLDALEDTVLRDVLGPQREVGGLVAVHARTKAGRPNEEAGARIVLRRVTVSG